MALDLLTNINMKFTILILSLLFLSQKLLAVDFDYIYISQNTISDYSVKKIIDFTESWQPIEQKALILILDNSGGETNQAIPLAESILNLANKVHARQNSPLFVYVEQTCLSACINTFFRLLKLSKQHPEKLFVKAHYSAVFGFHGARYGSFNFRILEMVYGLTVLSEEGSLDSVKQLIESGLNPDWLNKNYFMFKSINFTYKTAQELVLENSGLKETDLFGTPNHMK